MARKLVNQRIEELRKQHVGSDGKPMTQEEFALMLGMEEKRGRSTVNNWEQGAVQIKSDDLYNIGKTFDVSVDWLLGINDDPTPDQSIKAAARATGINGKALKKVKDKKMGDMLSCLIDDPDFEKLVLELSALIEKVKRCAGDYANLQRFEQDSDSAIAEMSKRFADAGMLNPGESLSRFEVQQTMYTGFYYAYLNAWKGKQDAEKRFSSVVMRVADPLRTMESAGERIKQDDAAEWG